MGKASSTKAERRAVAVSDKRKKTNRSWLFPVIIGAIVVVGVLLIVMAGGDHETKSPNANVKSNTKALGAGTQAPPLTGKDVVHGGQFDLTNYSGTGKPTLAVFWANWCPHCQKELPLIQSFYEQHKRDYNFVTTATSIGQKGIPGYETPDDFVKTVGLTMPTLYDSTGELGQSWDIESFPTMYVLDPDLKVSTTLTGEKDISEVQAALDAAKK